MRSDENLCGGRMNKIKVKCPNCGNVFETLEGPFQMANCEKCHTKFDKPTNKTEDPASKQTQY
jgi:ribosomal protein S27E